MINFDKLEVRDNLTEELIFDFLQEWGGDPEYSDFGLISSTICHNEPGVGSRKLYYYSNTGLFRCYTGCDSTFDIFELAQKVAKIQFHQDFDLNDAVRYVAYKIGFSGTAVDDDESKLLEDWKYLKNYDRIQDITFKQNHIVLKEYDPIILSRFNYKVKIQPWLDEGISQQAIELNQIGFFPGGDQITIPHFDKDGRFVGLRGRTVCQDEAEKHGKYRPLFVAGQQYNHPLGMNLYNLNFSKDNIAILKKAIVFEGEKSTLQYKSFFGPENDISVACCGSSISAHQIELLLEAGAQEIIIAFDRQFQELNDDEFKHLTMNLSRIGEKYSKYAVISCLFDKNKITDYKDSPTDKGKEIFLTLFKNKKILS